MSKAHKALFLELKNCEYIQMMFPLQSIILVKKISPKEVVEGKGVALVIMIIILISCQY
jgi:hypothetical protein